MPWDDRKQIQEASVTRLKSERRWPPRREPPLTCASTIQRHVCHTTAPAPPLTCASTNQRSVCHTTAPAPPPRTAGTSARALGTAPAAAVAETAFGGPDALISSIPFMLNRSFLNVKTVANDPNGPSPWT